MGIQLEDRGNKNVGWGSPPLPLWAHLLKVGIPFLGCDDKLDPFTHVVLKLTGGKEEVG